MGWRRSAAALLLAVFGALVLVNRACRHATARVQFDSGHALEASAEREAADNTVCHTELLQDVDIFGHDVGSHRADAAEECCVLCQGLPRCGAFSFVGGTCWFKGEVDMELDRQAYPGCISGKIRDKPETSTAAAHALPAATATQVLVPVAEESLRPGITLVLHGDTSRLPMMMQACHRWAGAVALSVLVYRGEELVAAERLLDRVAAERGRDRPLRWCAYRPPSIAPSARVSAGNEKATADVDGRGVADWVYPVNIMRNRALQLVETRQLMLIDGDFIPSDSMQQIARTGVEGLAAGSVLLVPPFQSRANVTSAGVADPQVVAALLRSKASLIKAVEAYSEAAAGDHHHNEAAAAAAVAQPAIAPYGPFLAWQVDYARWWEAADDYAVQSIFESEPYYVISTSAQLPFDERYVGFGGDKQEQWLRLGCGLTRIEVSATHYIVRTVVPCHLTLVFALHRLLQWDIIS